MKSKKFWIIRPIYIILIVVVIFLTTIIYFYNQVLFFIIFPIIFTTTAYSIFKILKIQDEMENIVLTMGEKIFGSKNDNLSNFPMASIIISSSGEILWYNKIFNQIITDNSNSILGISVSDIMGIGFKDLISNQGKIISYNEDFFKVYSVEVESSQELFYGIYLVDVTELEKINMQAKSSKPAVMLIVIDNYEESIENEDEGIKSSLIGRLQTMLQDFVDSHLGFIKKLSHDKYLVVVEQIELEKMIKDRFKVLDASREIKTEAQVPITLSIGVATLTETFLKAEKDARQAIEMAMGRGGDQAAIKIETGFEFFGGHSKGVEKRTKVKTRIVAASIVELLKSSSNVLVMGHKYADLDCLGSALGIAKASSFFVDDVFVVLDSKRNLATSLINRLEEEKLQNVILPPDIAIDYVNDDTLLFIVDTHTQNLLENIAVYKKAKKIVVIDHHRKMVDHIDNATIFYHEPYASSASEMVTELIQYFGDSCRLSKFHAEALLSGITLDTRNFVMRTSVRTFEAAAYLRRLGADTISVRNLFASTMDSYQKRARVVSTSEVYKDTAIAICDFTSDDIRIIAPQAADELLTITGVKAAFVIYEERDTVNVSARSMGVYNVQVIMEHIGGGGHHTTAGAQITDTTCDKVRQSICEIIDQIDDNSKGDK